MQCYSKGMDTKETEMQKSVEVQILRVGRVHPTYMVNIKVDGRSVGSSQTFKTRRQALAAAPNMANEYR